MKATPDRTSTRTYWIDEPRQLRCMVSPRRHDIVDRLAASGEQSIRDLAQAVGARPSALYHHVQKLLAAGLILESGSRVTNRRRERLYRTPAPRMRLYRALQQRRNAATFRQIVASMGRQMARDFRNGISADRAATSGEGRNLGMFRLVAYPDRATLARMNELLAQIAELLWQSPANGAAPIAFAWTMSPLQHNRRGENAPAASARGSAGKRRTVAGGRTVPRRRTATRPRTSPRVRTAARRQRARGGDR